MGHVLEMGYTWMNNGGIERALWSAGVFTRKPFVSWCCFLVYISPRPKVRSSLCLFPRDKKSSEKPETLLFEKVRATFEISSDVFCFKFQMYDIIYIQWRPSVSQRAESHLFKFGLSHPLPRSQSVAFTIFFFFDCYTISENSLLLKKSTRFETCFPVCHQFPNKIDVK